MKTKQENKFVFSIFCNENKIMLSNWKSMEKIKKKGKEENTN